MSEDVLQFMQDVKRNIITVDFKSVQPLFEAVKNPQYSDEMTEFIKYLMGVDRQNIREILVKTLMFVPGYFTFITDIFVKEGKTNVLLRYIVLNNLSNQNLNGLLLKYMYNYPNVAKMYLEKNYYIPNTLNNKIDEYIQKENSEARVSVLQKFQRYIVKKKEKYNYYTSESHREFCEREEKGIPSTFIKTTQEIAIPYKQFINKFRPEMLTTQIVPTTQHILMEVVQDNFKGGYIMNYGDSSTIEEKEAQFIALELPSFDWIQKNQEYINKLSTRDKFTIFGYTHNGDKFINLLLQSEEAFIKYKNNAIMERKKEAYFPLFFFIIDVMKEIGWKDYDKFGEIFEKDDIPSLYKLLFNKLDTVTDEIFIKATKYFMAALQEIIQNSPPTTKEMIVYRGVKDRYYQDKSGMFVNTTFLSTSFDPVTAHRFSGFDECCLKKIIIPPGARGLFMEGISMYSNEREILFGLGNSFQIVSTEKTMSINPNRGDDLDLCDQKYMIKEMTTMKMII